MTLKPFLDDCCFGSITNKSPLISTELLSLSNADQGTETHTSAMLPASTTY